MSFTDPNAQSVVEAGVASTVPSLLIQAYFFAAVIDGNGGG